MLLVTGTSLLQTQEIILALPHFEQVPVSDGKRAYRSDLYFSIPMDYIVTTLPIQEAGVVIKNFTTNNTYGESTPVCTALSSASSWLFKQ